MSDIRVARGWRHFGSNDLEIYNSMSYIERAKKDRKANNILKSLSKLSLEELEKEKLQAERDMAAAKEKYNKAVKEGKIKPKRKFKK